MVGCNKHKAFTKETTYLHHEDMFVVCDMFVILQTYTCSWSSEVVMLFWESLVIDGMSMCRKYEKEPNQILPFCKWPQRHKSWKLIKSLTMHCIS